MPKTPSLANLVEHRLRNFAGAVNLIGVHFFPQQRFQLLEKPVAAHALGGVLLGCWKTAETELAHEQAADKSFFLLAFRAASVNSSAARGPADILRCRSTCPFFPAVRPVVFLLRS